MSLHCLSELATYSSLFVDPMLVSKASDMKGSAREGDWGFFTQHGGRHEQRTDRCS